MPDCLCLLVIASSLFSPVYAADTPESGALPLTRAAILSNNCLTCHNSHSTDQPDLHSFKKDALAALLLQFKQEQTPSTLMGRLTKGYSDDDLRLIADFLGQ